ncbi:MAG: hypothetical protein NXH78_01395 [Hyphomonadaceae bacterium]|nr:hypothetical protein [Hyphomonadaceae bacterium]
MTALTVLLALNAIWFAMAFDAFYRRRKIFGKVMVPIQADRDNSAYEALVESGRFMGGFNLALSAFNVMLVFNFGGFEADTQWATLLIFNALAHGSQFFGNVPMAMQNRRGGGLWPVFKGVMLLIFVIDFTLMVANAAMAFWLLA